MAIEGRRLDVAQAVFQWFDQNAAQGILITDGECVVRGWNRWLVDATGLGREDVIGRGLFTVVPSLVERGFDKYYADALAGQVKILSHAFHRYVIPTTASPAWNGAQMPQAGRIGPLTDADGCTGTITVLENVADRVASEKLLRERIATAESASRAKDEFLATLSHEMRTPLNAVLGWTRILRSRKDVDPATLKRAIDVIDRNAAAQLTLVTDMLDIARISSGKVRLEMVPVDMAAVAAAAVDSVRPAGDAKSVAIVADCAAQLPLVSGDPDRLLQVAWNLLSNAVKFTDAGGRVSLSLSNESTSVALTVTDTGQGIEPAFLPHVFERFKQADASSSRRHGGLGLGLALVRDLVELHGGTVTATSGGPAQGATFKVSLPARGAGSESVAVRGTVRKVIPRTDGVLAAVNVLVVDDDIDGAEIVAHAVRAAGGAVALAGSAAEGLRRLREDPSGRPDVIVTDIGMADVDGYEFLASIRALPPDEGGLLPVIALTAYASPEDRARAFRAGFAAHVGKPLLADALIDAILQATLDRDSHRG
jgi:signal transduction histidine kinase/ActR/RegA family two-component response regulator